jgi:hypothetical protein
LSDPPAAHGRSAQRAESRRRTAIDLSQELRMKGLNQKKSDKKKPAKTMKEKKAEKAAKKAAKGR